MNTLLLSKRLNYLRMKQFSDLKVNDTIYISNKEDIDYVDLYIAYFKNSTKTEQEVEFRIYLGIK